MAAGTDSGNHLQIHVAAFEGGQHALLQLDARECMTVESLYEPIGRFFDLTDGRVTLVVDGEELDPDTPVKTQAFARDITIPVYAVAAAVSAEDLVKETLASAHPMFKEFLTMMYDRNQDVVVKAMTDMLRVLREDKPSRANSVAGAGLRHVFQAARRYVNTNENILSLAIRILAEAAVDDTVERFIFGDGGTELAMTVGKLPTISLDTQMHAARLFFNMSYCKENREEYVRKGAVAHIAFLSGTPSRQPQGDAGTIQKLMLSASKAFVMVAGLPGARAEIINSTDAMNAVQVFCMMQDPDIRLRAAKVIKALANDAGTIQKLLTYGDICAAVYSLPEEPDELRAVRDDIIEALSNAS